MRYLLFLLAVTLQAQTVKTTVTGYWYDGAGNPASGLIMVTPNKTWQATGGELVYPKTTYVAVSSLGLFSVALYPNDTGSPSDAFYNVDYVLAGGGRKTDYWVVPTSASSIMPPAVSSPPTPAYYWTLSQLLRSGATLGQVPVYNGSSWVPGVGGICMNFVGQTSVPYTHNLNSSTVLVVVTDNSGKMMVPNDWSIVGVNGVLVTFTVAKTGKLCVK